MLASGGLINGFFAGSGSILSSSSVMSDSTGTYWTKATSLA